MEIMGSIVNLLKPINATALKKGEGGEDITLWMKAGVPGGSIMNANEKYFYFHHTDGKLSPFYFHDKHVNYLPLG